MYLQDHSIVDKSVEQKRILLKHPDNQRFERISRWVEFQLMENSFHLSLLSSENNCHAFTMRNTFYNSHGNKGEKRAQHSRRMMK